MDSLREIASLFAVQQIEKMRHMDSDVFKNSKSYELYKAIKTDQFKTNNDAIQSLYGEGKGATDKFSKLKKKLKSILLNNLFLRSTENKTDYPSAYEDCLKNTCAVKILRIKGLYDAVTDVAESTLKKASKYHFTDICKDLTQILMLNYSLRGGGKREHYEKEFKKYQKIELDEKHSLALINEAAFLLAKHKKPVGDQLNKIISVLDEAVAIESDSYILNVIKFQCRISKANILNNHKETFAILNETITYLNSFPFAPPNGYLFNILNKISPSLIVTGKFEEAKRNIKKCLALRQKGAFNWHISLLYQMILGFYSEDYGLVKESILEARKYSKESHIQIIEAWKLAELNWYFVSLLGLTKYEGKMRIGKLLNEFTIYNKDKSGANVSIKLMSEYLIAFASRDRDTVIDKTDSLRLYAYNNLRDESNRRCYLFFWIIQQLPACAFELDRFKEVTKDKFMELKSIPANIVDLETEIIPYEKLYEFVLKILSEGNT